MVCGARIPSAPGHRTLEQGRGADSFLEQGRGAVPSLERGAEPGLEAGLHLALEGEGDQPLEGGTDPPLAGGATQEDRAREAGETAVQNLGRGSQ